MKLRELFEARSLPNENSNGRPIAHTAEALKNFWAWFKGSKVVDEHKRPLVMYHGTNADFAKFGYEYASAGVGQYGAGFYFTNYPSTASGYAKPDVGSPNVIPVYLNIKKPMRSNFKTLLSANDIKSFVYNSPNIASFLSDNYDLPYDLSNRETVYTIREIIDGFKYGNNRLDQLNLISNDLYKNQDEAFLQQCIEITKFDGVVHKHESGEYFYIAWNSNQIASAVGASGSYSGTDMINEYNKEDK